MTSQAVRRAAGSKPGGRLVQEDDVGVADQRERDIKTPSLPTRKIMRERVRLLSQSHQRDRVIDITGRSVVTRVQLHALTYRQARLGLGFLQHNADTISPSGVALCRVNPKDMHLTVCAVPKPLENLHGRGLASAVRTQEREDLSRPHVQIHTAHRLATPVPLHQAAHPDHRLRDGRNRRHSTQITSAVGRVQRCTLTTPTDPRVTSGARIMAALRS